MPLRAIVTALPYAAHLKDVAAHPIVSGLRLNTVMPLTESIDDALARLAALGPKLYVDLKARQLRVVEPAVPPYTEVKISHKIKVETPVDCYLTDGRETARIVGVEGNRLILYEGPRRLIGPGESINIIHPSLEIEGTLTETDIAFLEAMKRLGQKNVMLSYVEKEEDIAEVKALLPKAEIIAKIETKRGLDLVQSGGLAGVTLMAARGDLYVELVRPHLILEAVRSIIAADPGAVLASRLLPSMVDSAIPDCADIGDIGFHVELGYRTFLLGDALCLSRDPIIESLNLLQAIGRGYKAD